MEYFVSVPEAVNNYMVAVVVGLQVEVLISHYWLKRSSLILWEYREVDVVRSLVEAAIKELFLSAAEELKKVDPGFPTDARRDPEEIIRSAGRRLAYDTAVRVDEQAHEGWHNLFRACTTISSLNYEQAVGVGRMVVARKGHEAVRPLVSFAADLRLNEFRGARKLLELASSGPILHTDSLSVFGLVEVGEYRSEEEDLFEVNFLEHHHWELKDLEAKVANCRLYVSSFSEDGDNLSLWRGYAAGGGVSLGFGRDLLSLMQSPGSILSRVFYSPEEQLRLIEIVAHLHLLSIEWDREKALPEPDRLEELHKGYFGGTLLRHLAFLKNPGFVDEREVRIAYIEDQAMHERDRLKKATRRFRPRGRLLVPYIALSEDRVGWPIDARAGDVKKFRLPLVRVNVSPQLDSALEIRSIRDFLNVQGFTDVEVSSSVIPYRP